MGKFLDKSIVSVSIYILVYFLINLFFLFLANNYSDSLRYLLSFMQWVPEIYRFWVFFLLQEILLLSILGISFAYYYWNLRWIWINIKSYFAQFFDWYGFKPLFWYSFWFLFLYLFINGLLNFLLVKYDIKIPWFFGEQEVMSFLQWFKLNSIDWIIIMFFSVVIVWPLIEELIYRWFITSVLINKLWPWFWMFTSAFIFDLVHMEWAVFWNIFILSFILSYIFYKTKSIWYTFWFHVAVNWLAFVAMVATQFIKI